jgi:hydrogenase maturation protease
MEGDAPRILIAGIGNIFLGDDAFGSELARRLAGRPLPEGVRVIDFGIRGLDLAYALLDGYEAAILLDATARGGAPGTLYVIEPDPATADASPPQIDAHGLDPVQVLRLAAGLGSSTGRILLVGCEPATLGTEEDPVMGLSAPVAAAVAEAIPLVDSLVNSLLACPEVTRRLGS